MLLDISEHVRVRRVEKFMCVPCSKHVLDEEAKELRNKCAFWLGQDKDVQPRTGLQFFMRADTYSTTLLHCCTTGILVLFERSEFLIDTSQKKSLRVCTCARVPVCPCARVK